MLLLLVKAKDKHWLLFSLEKEQQPKKTLQAGRHESSVSYFHLIKFLASVMQRTWHRLNPGAEALPACESEPEKASAILGGAASNILTLVSCC